MGTNCFSGDIGGISNSIVAPFFNEISLFELGCGDDLVVECGNDYSAVVVHPTLEQQIYSYL
ncbi:hypothetical protein [Pseudarthrobacter sp. SSS035]|uniref:hypothetical protein n=1 Tax=Pseudarthrobacter sp. SSS035 TaxID=2931399 RepID=UPI002010953A|nr:hypothetical protein [Pseudarthrobacter sp. SSS035]